MSAPPPAASKTTAPTYEVARRLGEYKRLVRQTNLLGAALLAEVAVFNALHPNTPNSAFIEFLFVLSFVLAGASAALARGEPDYQADVIESLKERSVIDLTMTMDEVRTKSNCVLTLDLIHARGFFYSAIVLTVSAAVALLSLTFLSWYQPTQLPPPAPVGETSNTVSPPRFNLELFFSQETARIGLDSVKSQQRVAEVLANDLFKAFAANAGREFADKTLEIGNTGAKDALSSSWLIFFSRDSVEISDDGKHQLSELSDFFHRGDSCRVEIDGSADLSGSEKHNLWLSWRRANAAKAVLIGDGVDPSSVRTAARGSAEARASADPQQRRVEATVNCRFVLKPKVASIMYERVDDFPGVRCMSISRPTSEGCVTHSSGLLAQARYRSRALRTISSCS